MEITPILPPNDTAIDFDLLDCVLAGPEISIIEDKELSIGNSVSVIELIGEDSKITFFPDCSRQYLIMNFKNIDRFLFINILCVDDSGDLKYINITNKISFITIDKQKCKIPLEMGIGWQRVCLDLNEILFNSFGSNFAICKEITISGSCRLLKLYFESINYAEVELPKFLRILTE